MKTLLQNLFGVYTPLTNSNGDIIEGLAGIDYEYILGVLLFAIMLFCVLKILGGFIKNE